jgi:3-hydroxybutyryl-CoA dehydrogenase
MQKKIWILGDSPIVEEYATFCVEKNFDTKVRLNADAVTRDLPKGTKHFDESDASVDLVLELTNISTDTKRRNLVQLESIIAPLTPVFSSSVTVMVAEQVTWLKHPMRLIGIGALPTLLHGTTIEFAMSHQTDLTTREEAEQFAKSLSRTATFVGDSVGMVLPRILCALVNEACFAMMEGVAEGKDIDTAMKLGTNYPKGPVEWGERIGARHVEAVMTAMHKHFGEDRYRSAPLLHKAAMKNSFFNQK